MNGFIGTLPDLDSVKRYVSFAWTVPAIEAKRKRRTRRSWNPATARQFPAGTYFWATDRQLRNGGKRVALCRVTADVRIQNTRELVDDDWEWEGFELLTALGHTCGGMTPRQLWDVWHHSPQDLYLLEFEIIALMADLEPRPQAQGGLF